MSGICGLYRAHGLVEPAELRAMTEAMAALGPDGSALWHLGAIGFGHQACHLTLDATQEVLPYYDPLRQYAITADARLDNRAELCAQFGWQETPAISDSALILRAYEEWGKHCPEHLLGEFAVVIWDGQAQELVGFNDHTGERTFFYYHDANMLAFATEVAALHALPQVPFKPNLEFIAAQGNVSYVLNHPHLTGYEHIQRLPARTLWVLKNQQLTTHEYWQPDLERRLYFRSEDEYVEAFQALFASIIRAKLRSHRPVLTLHSGGLDSSSITAMAAELLQAEGQSLTALSAVLSPDYQGQAHDESDYIRQLQKPNLQLQSITDPWRGPFDELALIRQGQSEATRTSRYYLYRAFATAASAQGGRIILDGVFGEKGPSFHGEGYWAELLLQLRLTTLWRESRLYCQRHGLVWYKWLLREGLMPLAPRALQAKINLRSDIAFSKDLSFMKPSFIDRHIDPATAQQERLKLNTDYPNHRRQQIQAMNYRRASHHYTLADTGQPVAFCHPYNDKRLLEFCLALPGDLKIRNGYKRYAIRSGMRGLMPDTLRFRTTKEPFSPDFHDRYNRQLPIAREFVANTPVSPLMAEIVDVPRVIAALDHAMETNRCNTARDFTAMHTLPSALKWMAFLARFG